jgi:glutaredoxin
MNNVTINSTIHTGEKMKIEIYSKDGCPYCIKAKDACNAAKLPYTEIVVGKEATKDDIQKRVNALGLHTIISTVPQIFIDDKHVGGYTDLVRLYPWANK